MVACPELALLGEVRKVVGPYEVLSRGHNHAVEVVLPMVVIRLLGH